MTAITADQFKYEIEVNGLDLEALEEDAEMPQFPIIIVMAAIIKDILDPLSLGLIGFITTPILFLIIFFWMLGKGSFIKKMMRKWFMKRFVVGMLMEMIPFLNFAPVTTMLIFMAHFRETKIVKELDEIIEYAYYHKDLGLHSIINHVYGNR